MSKNNHFVKFLKKISISINSQLEKYLNKLNFKNPKNKLSNFFRSTKGLLALILIIFSGFVYLSIPYFFEETKLKSYLKNQFAQKYNFNFNFSENLEYSFFPVPNFTFQKVDIFKNDKNLANIKHLRVNLSLKNLYSLNNLKVKNILLEDANFNFFKEDIDFFTKVLKNDFSDFGIEIIDSKVFFRNFEKEVLFINKIKKMKYYYDDKILQNILYAENEIFKFPYSLTLYEDSSKKKIFSKFNLNILKLQIENELDYTSDVKKGLINSIYNKRKSRVDYKFNKNKLYLNFFDKSLESKFNYKANVNFNPFYTDIEGDINKIDIFNFFNTNSVFTEIFKTEILNNENLTVNLNLNSRKILPYHNIENLIFKFRIKEGLIDIDKTNFNLLDYANFKISNSLLYVKDNNLILDGQLIIEVKNYNEIYKLLQTPRDFRSEIKKVELSFIHNFDQKKMNINNIKINGQVHDKVNNIIKEFTSTKNKLQNRIYLKNLMNKAIKSYAG